MILVHTPHLEDKRKGTRLIMDCLKANGVVKPERVIIDHVEEHTIQREGYVEAFRSEIVHNAIEKGIVGRIADTIMAFPLFVLAMVALGLARILRGPGDADRMMAAQLLGTGGIAAQNAHVACQQVRFRRTRIGIAQPVGGGLRLAYSLAKQNFSKNAVNRVILLSDGDFNVGINTCWDFNVCTMQPRIDDVAPCLNSVGPVTHGCRCDGGFKSIGAFADGSHQRA